MNSEFGFVFIPMKPKIGIFVRGRTASVRFFRTVTGGAAIWSGAVRPLTFVQIEAMKSDYDNQIAEIEAQNSIRLLINI